MNIQILIVGIQGTWSWEARPYTASVSIRGAISASPHQTFSLGVLGFQIQRSFPLALGDQSHRKLQLVPNFVYSFLEAAITNHHKPGGLKQQGCIVSRFWRPQVWDHRHWARTRTQAAQCTLQRLWRGVYSVPPPASGECQHFSVAVASLQSLLPSSQHLLLLCVSLLRGPLRLYLGSTQLSQGDFPALRSLITAAKTLLSNKVTFTGSSNQDPISFFQ